MNKNKLLNRNSGIILKQALVLALLFSLFSVFSTPLKAAGASDISEVELSAMTGLGKMFVKMHNRRGGFALPIGSDGRVQKNTRGSQREKALHTDSVGEWQRFLELAAYVMGDKKLARKLSYADAELAFFRGKSVRVMSRPGMESRDNYIFRLNSLGYKPEDIYNVVSGRITLAALSQADRMRSLGYSRGEVSDYLDRQHEVDVDVVSPAQPASGTVIQPRLQPIPPVFGSGVKESAPAAVKGADFR